MARRPIWLWPNLLSLDAPLVALAWFWVFKHVWLVTYTQPTLPWLLAVAVWCIYVADRLIDERLARTGFRRETARHKFHRRFRVPLTIALLLGVLASLVLLPLQGRGLLPHGIFVLVPVAGYFALSFYENGRAISYFKNLLAGLAFAYGTAVGVHFHGPESHNVFHLIRAPEVLTFALLCMLNMTAIDHWEQPWEEGSSEKDAFEAVLTILLLVLAGFALFMAVRAEQQALVEYKAYYVAIMVGAAGLYVTNRLKSGISMNARRVLADVAMLLPLPIFFGMLRFYEVI